MVIQDVTGRKYRLSSNKITEFPYTAGFRYVRFTELRNSYGGPTTPVRYVGHRYLPVNFFNLNKFSLGCREFSPANFAKILKAAGIRKTEKP